jgi:hypothetical protein
VTARVAALVCQDWFRFRGVRRKDMSTYSTTNGPEDGPILANPVGTRPILPVDVTLSSLKGLALRRHSKLATDSMDLASTTTLAVTRS